VWLHPAPCPLPGILPADTSVHRLLLLLLLLLLPLLLLLHWSHCPWGRVAALYTALHTARHIVAWLP